METEKPKQKTLQILHALQAQGPMCARQLQEQFGNHKSVLANLMRAGCVETYMHFNPNIDVPYARREVTFYAATGTPYLSRRIVAMKKPHNYDRDKARSLKRIPECIAYLEKWGYKVIYEGDAYAKATKLA